MRGNTLRLRLTRSEVDAIGDGQTVAEATHFPGGSALRYALVPGRNYGARISNDSGDSQITIEVPTADGSKWATDETQVGLTDDQPFTIDELEVLIEKDFTCVTPREGEEELDTFPNPNVA